jgi:hypothetical protein
MGTPGKEKLSVLTTSLLPVMWLKISNQQGLEPAEYIHVIHTAVLQLYVEEMTYCQQYFSNHDGPYLLFYVTAADARFRLLPCRRNTADEAA